MDACHTLSGSASLCFGCSVTYCLLMDVAWQGYISCLTINYVSHCVCLRPPLSCQQVQPIVNCCISVASVALDSCTACHGQHQQSVIQLFHDLLYHGGCLSSPSVQLLVLGGSMSMSFHSLPQAVACEMLLHDARVSPDAT